MKEFTYGFRPSTSACGVGISGVCGEELGWVAGGDGAGGDGEGLVEPDEVGGGGEHGEVGLRAGWGWCEGCC